MSLDDEPGVEEQLEGLAERAPMAPMDASVDIDDGRASGKKKRGRPSRSTSQTPARAAPSKTPKSAKSTATPKSYGRKRKAAEVENEPEEPDEPEDDDVPAKNGRPVRTTGVAASARISARSAKRAARGSNTVSNSRFFSKPRPPREPYFLTILPEHCCKDSQGESRQTTKAQETR